MRTKSVEMKNLHARNRLVGDATLPEEQRHTAMPLYPSNRLGEGLTEGTVLLSRSDSIGPPTFIRPPSGSSKVAAKIE